VDVVAQQPQRDFGCISTATSSHLGEWGDDIPVSGSSQNKFIANAPMKDIPLELQCHILDPSRGNRAFCVGRSLSNPPPQYLQFCDGVYEKVQASYYGKR
jgi:hypothetical protein